jgi:hypothetical protein
VTQASASTRDAASGPLARLDAWVAANPWHPRVLPFLVYIAGLFVVDMASKHIHLLLFPPLYTLQIAVVAWLVWRYRRFTPEVTLRFHWLAVPTGLLLCWAWIELGRLTIAFSDRFAYFADRPHDMEIMFAEYPTVAWGTLAMRFLGMVLLVPIFEELFTRSALLRGLHHARPTAVGAVQIAHDMPVIGEWVAETRTGQEAAKQPGQLTRQLLETPLGRLSVFGVFASTMIFMFNHSMRDWLGCIACGLVWCALLWWTNRAPARGDLHGKPALGLGPIIWSHAITNAALWAYCTYTGDWQWM